MSSRNPLAAGCLSNIHVPFSPAKRTVTSWPTRAGAARPLLRALPSRSGCCPRLLILSAEKEQGGRRRLKTKGTKVTGLGQKHGRRGPVSDSEGTGAPVLGDLHPDRRLGKNQPLSG